jgi:cell division septation protein DedD
MVTIEQLIGELLLRHNCVIIPSFGGFVAKQTAATIDYVNGFMSPPKKALLFNRQLMNNDGLLQSELAASNNISYDHSSELVAEKVAFWNETLKKGERIVIDKVGFLFFDQEKNICFEQDRFFNLLLESYGLGKVHFLTEEDVQIVAQTAIEITTTINAPEQAIVAEELKIEPNTAKVIEHPALKERSKAWKYVAAAACILPIGFYSYWLPMKTPALQSGILSVRDFNPFQGKYQTNYQKQSLQLDKIPSELNTLEEQLANLPEDATVLNYQYDASFSFPIVVKEKSVVETVPTNENTVNTTVVAANFNYIVGCFSSESNAKKVVALLKAQGMNAFQLDVTNGLHRISAGSGNSVSDLDPIITKAKAAGFEGWILK